MSRSLRIAFLAPLKRPITPDGTASRPRVIFDLASELILRGHHLTIFGTGDSNIAGATLVPVIPKAINLLPPAENPEYQHMGALTRLISQVVKRQDEFDVIHNHMYPEFLALLVSFTTPIVTTVHAQMTPDLAGTLAQFPKAHLVAISHAAKRASGLPMEVVHNGIDTDFFVPDDHIANDYLLFVGRMSRARGSDGNFLDPKGVMHAIAIAEKTGERLKIVGNVEDITFYDKLIKPHLSTSIEFVGEVSAEQQLSRQDMVKLFAGAKALLNPINWEEPFGLVMAEAMACGTPVLVFNRGSASELVVDGKTGFVIDPASGREGFVAALNRLAGVSRAACREHAVANFSKKRMADDYEAVYEKA